MNRFTRSAICAAIFAASVPSVYAATDVFFNPLTQSAAVAQVPNHINELNSPWQLPAGITYKNLTSLKEIEADPSQSSVRVPGLGTGASMTDMAAFDPSGRYIFLPHETMYGAGLSRYDMKTDKTVNLFKGDMNGEHGEWSGDYGALDPATWTPKNTILVAEEWSGQGRMFEVVNPMADVEAGEEVIVNELTNVPNVSIEGLRPNHAGTAIYFIDEDKSGSFYKYVPTVKDDYSKGQTFVLVVNDFAGDASKNWNDAANVGAVRTGKATWVAITDVNGKALTEADPFDNVTRGGRAAADEVNGTPYGRPEDLEVGYVRNGNEVIYCNATSENAVYSIEELGNGEALVRLAVDPATTPYNLGYAGTTGTISDPDNLAQDALGNIYIVEDKPNGDNIGGDVWFLRDTDNDGVAESIDHFMSLQVKGAENTGMIFRPNHPTQFIINVQHPDSTDVAGGMGDATWLIDMKGVVAPPCVKDDDHHEGSSEVNACNSDNNSNFVEALKEAGR